jgi:hypothetical protein
MPHTPDVRYYVPEWKHKERDEDGSAVPNRALHSGAEANERYRAGAIAMYPATRPETIAALVEPSLCQPAAICS